MTKARIGDDFEIFFWSADAYRRTGQRVTCHSMIEQ